MKEIGRRNKQSAKPRRPKLGRKAVESKRGHPKKGDTKTQIAIMTWNFVRESNHRREKLVCLQGQILDFASREWKIIWTPPYYPKVRLVGTVSVFLQ